MRLLRRKSNRKVTIFAPVAKPLPCACTAVLLAAAWLGGTNDCRWGDRGAQPAPVLRLNVWAKMQTTSTR